MSSASPRREDVLERDRRDAERRGVEEWRGVAAEHNDEVAERASGLLKRRSRALLADLLRPYLKTVWLLVAVVVIENAARLSIPRLVQLGIDHGIPPLLNGGRGTVLYEIIAVMLVALVVQTISRMAFLRGAGKVGQQVLLELRRRLFTHFQKLDVRFHDRYTTGRVVSRLTNDIDAIMELLTGGFDGLVTAVLTMVGVGILLLTLDFQLGAVCLIGFPVLALLVRWFSRASSRAYRKVREYSALVIVQFVETMTGIRAVHAYRREPRNAEIFSGLAHRYQDANVRSFRLVAIFSPSVRLVGNITIGIVLLYVAIVVRVFVKLLDEEDQFQLLAAAGLTTQFGVQAMINMAVNTQLAPSKGMTLPFISYGGSSMLALSLGFGLLLAFTRRNPYLVRSPYVFKWSGK